jgi:pilus assembly protein TadC
MSFKQKILIAIGLVTVGVVGRLVPHLWNMTPVAGVAILAGYKMGWKWGVVIPVFSMFLGDIIIGFYSFPILLSVYVSLILTGLLGNLVSKYRGVSKIFGVTIFSTTLFFVFTN